MKAIRFTTHFRGRGTLLKILLVVRTKLYDLPFGRRLSTSDSAFNGQHKRSQQYVKEVPESVSVAITKQISAVLCCSEDAFVLERSMSDTLSRNCAHKHHLRASAAHFHHALGPEKVSIGGLGGEEILVLAMRTTQSEAQVQLVVQGGLRITIDLSIDSAAPHLCYRTHYCHKLS